MAEWTFLTNHALALSFMAKHSRITARDLATAIGITERAVRKIIADLIAEGYVTKKKEGRRVKYRVNPDLSLRHDSQLDTAVGDLLETLGWKRRRKRSQSTDQPVGARPTATVETDR